jgi:hypothetical protein
MTNPTPADWRALCAELVENLERYQCWYIEDNGYGIDELEALLRRADAALSQPEPQGPTDEDFEDLADAMNVTGDPVPTMRPKPPSLKEQALETLKYPKDFWSEAEVDTIRRALEALPE